MHYHQNNEQSSQIKMDVSPFVAGHGPQRLNFADPAAAVKLPAVSARAGWQYGLDNKAGNSQAKQGEKADRIDDKIQRYTFHCTSTFKNKEIKLTVSSRRLSNGIYCMSR
jgi:hypothetical protein